MAMVKQRAHTYIVRLLDTDSSDVEARTIFFVRPLILDI